MVSMGLSLNRTKSQFRSLNGPSLNGPGFNEPGLSGPGLKGPATAMHLVALTPRTPITKAFE